ncbi:MAG: SUMF1/EgtB/PvdO family nonheme iron enzyme [Myxococcota bacterium]
MPGGQFTVDAEDELRIRIHTASRIRSFRLRLLLAVAFLFAAPPALAQISIDYVTVGGPGNAPDTTGFGSVADIYQIGKFEVTNDQYAAFLNAKAAADPLELYNQDMGSDPGGITRSGTSGNFTYSAIAGREHKPVNFVSFYDGLRFANWLHNGQGDGETETGAYRLADGPMVTRNPEATIFLPSENEWYKAAYYDADAEPPSYFEYPAGTDDTSCAVPGAAANTANCDDEVADLTDVGSYTNSASPNGSFDQGGNVLEWNETILEGNLRGLRAGDFINNASGLATSFGIGLAPSAEFETFGFRVASIPEPESGLLQTTALLVLLAWRKRCA